MVLELKNIRMTYSSAHKKSSENIDLLNGVDLMVEKGKVTALIGGNGAGKTTLFNIISGFEKDYKGRVLLDREDISKLPAHRIAQKGIGRLFQGRQLSEDLTLLENMKIASDDTMGEHPWDLFRYWRVAKREAEKEKQAKDILNRLFGAENKYLGLLHQKSSRLSYGEQRLMAMARLLMGNNDLLLLDEPTSGVNPAFFETSRDLIRIMVEKEGKTILLIEHNMDFVHNVADYCCYLADGRIIKGGTVQEVLDDPVIRKDYLGL